MGEEEVGGVFEASGLEDELEGPIEVYAGIKASGRRESISGRVCSRHRSLRVLDG